VKCLRAICLLVLCLSILVLVSPVQAEEHTVTVYGYNEDTGEWEPIGDNGVYCIISSSAEFYGTTSSSSVQITAKARVDIDNQEKTFSQNAITVQNKYPNPGVFTITVEPLTENVEIIDEEDYDYDFLMRKLGERAAWRFTYQVENISENGEVMNNIVVADNFGAELDIFEDQIDRGALDITTKGAMDKWFFEWSGFSLNPGESAELIIEVELGRNPAGKQEYTACDSSPYDLNSGGTLKYTTPGKPGLQTREGYNFKVHVDCSYICIEFSATVIEWFIRKPGDYYAKTATASVESSKPVVVTFSEFDVLRGDYDRTLDVRYAFNDGLEWLSPDDLNAYVLELDMVGGVDGFELWQRVILLNQQPCTYQNEGVITFSIANSETSIF